MSLSIGDVLTRSSDGHRFRLVGISHDGHWLGEPLDAFGPVEVLTARLLADGFGVEDAAEPVPVDERAILHQRDSDATADANAAHGRNRADQRGESVGDTAFEPPEGSVEAIFRAIEADDAKGEDANP